MFLDVPSGIFTEHIRNDRRIPPFADQTTCLEHPGTEL